jgi:hypothetical protein
MNANTLRTLSVTGAVATLLVAASPAWAHYERYGHHYGYGPRYVQPYRPAVVVVPPVVRYVPPPVYYVPPPAYVPAPVYYRAPLRVHHWHGRGWAYRG